MRWYSSRSSASIVDDLAQSSSLTVWYSLAVLQQDFGSWSVISVELRCPEEILRLEAVCIKETEWIFALFFLYLTETITGPILAPFSFSEKVLYACMLL